VVSYSKDSIVSREYFQKACDISLSYKNIYALGYIYFVKFKNYHKVIELFDSLANSGYHRDIYELLGESYLRLNQIEKAKQVYHEAYENESSHPGNAYNLACYYSVTGDKKSALKWLETALKNGMKNFEYIESDEDLKNLMTEKKFHSLIKKYKEQ
jgi:tetratricopeptide (TPR) repeat protein